MRKTSRAAAAALALTLAAALLPASITAVGASEGAGRASDASSVEDTDFYTVPDPLPAGEPGDLIRSEVVESDLDGTLYRVMYHSRSLQGADIAVTGLVVVPSSPAPAGGYPVISWAHGTTGIADICAPSKEAGGSSIVQLGNVLLEAGYLLTATDYEGLATPGRHPYIVGESEARGTIDIVRAARQLVDDVSENWLVWGHSQGGHAALWTSQIASTWAPELNLVGTVAGAPPSHLNLVYHALKNSPFRYYILMAGVGIEAAYPEADLSEVATPLAMELLGVVDTGCTGAIHDAYKDYATDELIAADPYENETWARLIDAQEPGTVRTDNPILIIHGGEDEQIPVVSSELLLRRMCDLGQVVERRVYPGQSHAGVIGPSFADMMTWMAARFAGEEAPNQCDGPIPPVTTPTTVAPSTTVVSPTTPSTAGAPTTVPAVDPGTAPPATPVAGEADFTG